MWCKPEYVGSTLATVDILEDYEIRQGIKEYSNWPTIPQVYIDGQFVGGSVLIEMYQKGELQQMVEVLACNFLWFVVPLKYLRVFLGLI